MHSHILVFLLCILIATASMTIYQEISLLSWRNKQNLTPSARFSISLSSEPRKLAYLPAKLQPVFNDYLAILSALTCISASIHTELVYLTTSSPKSTSALLSLMAAFTLTTLSTTWTNLLYLFTNPLSKFEIFTSSSASFPSTSTIEGLLGAHSAKIKPGVFSSRPVDLESWSCGLSNASITHESWNLWTDICTRTVIARYGVVGLWILMLAMIVVIALWPAEEETHGSDLETAIDGDAESLVEVTEYVYGYSDRKAIKDL